MDDVVLDGHADTVTGDVEMFVLIQRPKCELIFANGSHPIAISLKDHVQIEPAKSCLLGVPLLPGNAMVNALEARCDDLDRATSRLKLLSAHDALFLRLARHSAPKIMHILRCSPCSDHTRLLQFDISLRQCLYVITDPDLTDIQWSEASLPVKAGGFGVRRAATLAS